MLQLLYFLVFLSFSCNGLASTSSYLVVFHEASERSRENIGQYSKRLRQDLELKLINLQASQGLLSIIDDQDKLWISQSVRMDLKEDQVDRLLADPSVLKIVADTLVYLDQPAEGKNSMRTGKITYGLESLEVPEVWERYGFRGNGVTVGVLDTGWADHADLRGKVLRSKDFISKFEDNKPNDDQGHGTHCMGSIGGGNKSGKSIGVAPDVKFIVAKVFDSRGRSSRSAILKAMQWITDPDGNPETNDYPRVISNSWGKEYEGFDKELQYRRATTLWREFGIAPVFAAGNSGPSKNAVVSPAALDTTLAVAAVDEKDKIASFSSRGAVEWENGQILQKPDIAAPGVDVYSSSFKGGYVSYSGTSMACPHVAGVVALMLQANPNLTVDEIFSILKQSALELGEPGWDIAYGHGKISALRAVEIALKLGYLDLQISSQGAPVRVHVKETGQVYRFDSGQDFKLHLKQGSYQLLIQSFGSQDQKVQVDVAMGSSTSLTIEMKKAPTFTWNVRVVNGDREPIEASMHFPDTPVGIQQIRKEGTRIELPAAYYRYLLKANGYAPEAASIDLSTATTSILTMSALKPVLIVNATNNEIYSRFIKSAIPRRYQFEYTNKPRTLSLEELQNFRRVIWFTGIQNFGALRSDSRIILQNYFESGGTIILTGQNTQENLGQSGFTEKVFGIKVTDKKSSQTRLMGEGLKFNLNEKSSAKNQDSPEEIISVKDDTKILLNWLNGRGAVSERSLGEGKAFYVGFGVEGLSMMGRTRFMGILLERSEPSLVSALQRALRATDVSMRARSINLARSLKPLNRHEASQAIQILENMGLEDDALYHRIQLFLKFQQLH